MEIEEIGVFEAKTRLSELLDRVARGQAFRITKRGKPVAELRPIEEQRPRPRYGAHRGQIFMRDDFDDPLPEFDKYTR